MTEIRKPNTIGYDVDYDILDAYKMEAMAAAKQTAQALIKVGFQEIPQSRGESVYLIKGHGMILAFVVEGVGTLNKVAEEILESTGVSYMAQIHRANFATIVNDLTASGAYPLIANGLISVGGEKYFQNPTARSDSIRGWKEACLEVGCSWGGGETQKLRDIVVPSSAVLGGAAVGFIKPVKRWVRGNIRAGDIIIVVYSSGVHANGVTMARDTADALGLRYDTKLSNGETYGEALLKAPHCLYGPLTQMALNLGIPIRYISNITGHGWRKIMRLEEPFTYVIEQLPKRHPVFNFIQEHTGATDRRMLETFNMGGGVAYFVPPSNAGAFVDTAIQSGYPAYKAGYVKKGPRRVEMPGSIGVFESEEYAVR